MAPAQGVMRGPISRTPAQSQGTAAVRHQHAALRSSCRKRAPPESCTGQFLRAGWERICRDRRDARSHFLLCGGCLSGVLRSLERHPPRGGTQNLIYHIFHV